MKKDTIIRTVLLALALLNQCLIAAGKPIIPLEEEGLGEFISQGFTVVVSVAAWWKNNSFTSAAIQADEYMKEIKHENASYTESED